MALKNATFDSNNVKMAIFFLLKYHKRCPSVRVLPPDPGL